MMETMNTELVAAMQAAAKREKADKLERFRYLNRYAKKKQIVFAGSSLMEQFPIYEFVQDFDIPLKIYNRGIGGYTTTEFSNALQECVFDLEPTRLFLNIGTNDFNTPDYDETVLMNRYGQILKAIQGRLPDTQIFVMAYYPINEQSAKEEWTKQIFRFRTNERLRSANAALCRLAAHFHVKYIDVNHGLYDASLRMKAEYTIDGIHMFANGYQSVLRELMPYLLAEQSE